MKEEQDKLEKKLWTERENIRKSHEERVNVAKNKYVSCPPFLSPLPTFLQGKADWRRPVRARCTGIKPYATNPFQVLHLR